MVELKRIIPFDLLSTWLTDAARDTAPPIWNVRMVNWVPGSPIDCAAITPTASPILINLPRPKSRP